MPFRFDRLNERTRGAMLTELKLDAAQGRLQFDSRLTETGRSEWPEMVASALIGGDERTLARCLGAFGVLRTQQRRLVEGRVQVCRTPVTFATQLADDVFNHYYVRAVCLRAIAHSLPAVEVYRAKLVREPRPESEALVGARLDPRALLADLRDHGPEEVPELGVPGGPNSGLSVRFPQD